MSQPAAAHKQTVDSATAQIDLDVPEDHPIVRLSGETTATFDINNKKERAWHSHVT